MICYSPLFINQLDIEPKKSFDNKVIGCRRGHLSDDFDYKADHLVAIYWKLM